MAEPAITVHVQLPTSADALTQLGDDDSDWAWAPWLRIPIAELRIPRFVNTRREPMRSPFKWVRFLTGITLGAEGRFQVHAGATDFAPYDLDSRLPDESIELFYHVEPGERRRMVPSDPGMLHEHTATPTYKQEPSFSEGVRTRDRTCALTDVIWPGSATHIVPHSEGDEYIASLTSTGAHVRGADQNDVVSQIDDIRNGVYLDASLHIRFGKDLAFMVTPNFAMDTSDLDPSMQPTDYCCTAHVFAYGEPGYYGQLALGVRSDYPLSQDVETLFSGASVRRSGGLDWPPDISFNAVYGALAFRAFGIEDSAKAVEHFWGERLRTDVIRTPAQRAQARMDADKLAAAQKRAKETEDRRAREDNRNRIRESSTVQLPSDDSITDDFTAMERSFYRSCLPRIAQMKLKDQQERESALLCGPRV